MQISREGDSTLCRSLCPRTAWCGSAVGRISKRSGGPFTRRTRYSVDARAPCHGLPCKPLPGSGGAACRDPGRCRSVGMLAGRPERRPGGGRPHSGHCCAMPCRAVNGRDPCRRALRWPGRGRSSLYRGAVAQRSFRRSSPLRSNQWRINGSMLNILAGHHAGGVLPARRTAGGVLPARRTAAAPDDHDAGCAEAGLRAHRPWRPP